MISIFKKKKTKGNIANFKVDGMHCSSCVMNIDGSLEDMDGVFRSSTSYKRGTTTINYDPQIISVEKLQETINAIGYKVKQTN